MNANPLRPPSPHRMKPRPLASRGGFTLIEILVALGIFSILLTIIMVPLNMGVNLTRIGSARTDTQQAAQTLMNRIVTEVRGASYVFPNEPMVGITDKVPYLENKADPKDLLGYPYLRANTGSENACGGTKPLPFANTSRLEFLSANKGTGDPATSVVSFYTARADVSKAWSAMDSYAADLNPIVMYRAQIPFERDLDPATSSSAQFLVGGQPNALLGDQRLPSTTGCTANAAAINSGARWLMHDGAGEPFLALQRDPAGTPSNPALQDDLSPTTPTKPTQAASNNRVTPLGVGLYAPQADNDANATNLKENQASGRMFTPATTFICEDTNANGIIDRVTITLVMGKYDGAGAENRAQSVRLTQTVDLPNTESRFSNTR